MRIAMAGSSGLIGSALIPYLTSEGHEVIRLDRKKPFAPQLRGVEIVINLAGESISEGRWTEDKKRRLRDSRIKTTQALVEAMKSLDPRPKLLINASAIGFYGNRGEEKLNEKSASGSGFLASICQEWEAAANHAKTLGVRVVTLRFGVVLSPTGGALKAMLTPFKLGLGGVIGSGDQWMSWIALEDVPGIVQHLIQNPDISGPVNAVSPHPVRNADFTKQLGQQLHRPTVIPLPAFAARLMFGEMADELLLSSSRVIPAVLEGSHYLFQHPKLDPAIFYAQTH